MRFTLLLGLIALAACARMPDLGSPPDAAAEAAPWPRIVPLGPVLDSAESLTITPDVASDLSARGAALRQRAARLRGAVIEEEVRETMEEFGSGNP